MSVGSGLYTLLKSNLRTWVSAKGFWLVAAAALLPTLLTGAWVAAHTADVAVTDLRIEGGPFTEGDEARFVATVRNLGEDAVDAFNVTLAVGEVQAGRLFPEASQTVTIASLAPGESRDVDLTWNATPGVVYVLANVDDEDVLGERDEFNNQKAEPLAVARELPPADQAPSAPLGLAGDENATTEVDLAITSIARGEGDIVPGENATFTATVENQGAQAVEDAQVVLRVARTFAGRSVAVQETTQNVTLEAGASTTLELVWTAQEGAFWQEAYVLPPEGARDPQADDNYRAEAFVVNAVVTPDMTPPQPEERLTIKQFYLQVLSLLHLRILLPLIALFYAAGVIADERERGSLPYVLTRPIPRWLIPITKFAASFLVAAIATIVGVALTYAFLFGTTIEGSDVGYLTTPLLMSLLTLFVYGALFIFVGTVFERPYLVGLIIVLGWEFAAFELVPWVSQLTLTQHIGNAIAGWPLGEGVQWLPEGDQPMRAFLLLLGLGAVFLALASAQMRRREFEVG